MFSKRLKQVRKLKKLSQEELARKINTTKGTISNYENKYSTPSNDVLSDLATMLGVTTDYLLGRSDQPHLTEEEAFEAFKNDPSLERWYKELPSNSEEDLQRLRKMWELLKEDN